MDFEDNEIMMPVMIRLRGVVRDGLLVLTCLMGL